MPTDSSNLSPQSSSAPSPKQAEESIATTIEQIPTEELSRPSCCVSSRAGRAFVGRMDYEGEKALDAAPQEAERALPKLSSAYKPTGKTTVTAALLMLVATPLVLLVLIGICGALCWGWLALVSHFSTDQSYSQSRLLGLLSLLLDLALVVLMVVIPMGCFGALSKWFKNRNPVLPAVLTGIVDLIVAIVLFVPIWKGETLAPTHLTFLFIPVRWVLIGIGGVIVPLAGAAVVHGKVSEQKFCEESGCYLKRFREIFIPFDSAENALALLRRGEYLAALRLPKLGDAEHKGKHWARISLWWQEQAATAFLEMELRFRGKSKSQKKLTTEESKDRTKEWLGFSVQLDRGQAELLAQELR